MDPFAGHNNTILLYEVIVEKKTSYIIVGKRFCFVDDV